MGRPSNKERLKKAIDEGNMELAQELMDKISKKSKPKEEKQSSIEESFVVNNSNRRGKRKFVRGEFKNLFNENDFKNEESVIKAGREDKQNNIAPVARMRSAARKVTVKCYICGKEKQISATLGTQQVMGQKSLYRCDSCMRG